MVKQSLSPNLDDAGKVIQRIIGKVETLDYQSFYKLFCRGILWYLIQDMLGQIEVFTKLSGRTELPLNLQLDEFKRLLMIHGIDKENELKARGQQILNALVAYQKEMNPKSMDSVSYD